MLNYHDQQSLKERYQSTVIYLKNDPIYVQYTKDYRLGYSLLSPQLKQGDFNGCQEVNTDTEALRDAPFNLGYFNGDKKTVYDDYGDIENKVEIASFVARMPVRRWKQGLSDENLCFTSNNIRFAYAVKHQGFIDMLKGQYPTAKTAFGMLNKKVNIVAYHRHWAYRINKMEMVELLYRERLVGIGDDYANIKLSKKFNWLRETYEIGVGNEKA